MSSPTIGGAILRPIPRVHIANSLVRTLRPRSGAQLFWVLEVSALALMVFGGLALRVALCLTQALH